MSASTSALLVLYPGPLREAVRESLEQLGVEYATCRPTDILASTCTERQVNLIVTAPYQSSQDQRLDIAAVRAKFPFASHRILTIVSTPSKEEIARAFEQGADEVLSLSTVTRSSLTSSLLSVDSIPTSPAPQVANEVQECGARLVSSLSTESKLMFCTAHIQRSTQAQACAIVLSDDDGNYYVASVIGQISPLRTPSDVIKLPALNRAILDMGGRVSSRTEPPSLANVDCQILPLTPAGSRGGFVVLIGVSSLGPSADARVQRVANLVGMLNLFLSRAPTRSSRPRPARPPSSSRDATAESLSTAEAWNSPLPLDQTEFLLSLLNASPSALLFIEPSGKIRFFNQAAETLFDYPAARVLGSMHFTELLPKSIHRPLVAMLEGTPRRHEDIRNLRTPIRSKQGRVVPVTLSAISVTSSSAHLRGVAVTITEISQRIRMEVRLSEAQQRNSTPRPSEGLVTQLAGAAAHELNQPLTVVMGYAEMIKRMGNLDEKTLSWIDVILEETERMAHVVKRIGRITNFRTKDYIGATKIVDLHLTTDDDNG